jgi:putative heme-binding domain-containing protein
MNPWPVSRALCLLAVLPVLWAPLALSQDTRLVRETEALPPAGELARLRVPEGFEIALFASEPMINKPINLAFDTRGRLWVSSTVEYPYAAARERWEDESGSRVRDSRDAIKILEDTDGDGRADRVTDFADGLNIPTGVLPWTRPGDAAGCIAWSIPNIWYFGDRDGDGRCDTREVLFGPLGYEKDTHGMCSSFRLGGDGWVYATHGFNNSSTIRVRPENLRGAKPGDLGTALDLHSGNVFRFLPDGSRVEIWSWGQVNPFGLAWDRRGNLYSADCHSAPVYQLLRGAHYPSFGKPHDGLGFGPAMITHTHGSTGICGIAWLDDGGWGAGWNDRVFIGNVVTSRVNLDRIEWRGSTPVAVEEPDFIVSEDPWFRPVDLQFGPDGALYVADFYNRIIGHYEVPLDHPGRDRERGRIWRVQSLGKPDPVAEETSAVTPENAIESLRNPSPHDRRAAAAHLQASPRAAAVGPLIETLAATPAEDTHLIHALKLALREQLSLPDSFDGLSGIGEEAKGALVPVVLAVKSPEASAFLLERWRAAPELDATVARDVLMHVGRYADVGTTSGAVDWARATGEPPPETQTGRLIALHDGRLEREGIALTPELSAWAVVLARGFIESAAGKAEPDWRGVDHPDHPGSESPWTLQDRPADDGATLSVISSLRKGEPRAEQRTGILRSRVFSAPTSLSLWLCGHRGAPGGSAHSKNLVRLIRESGSGVVASAFPPRSDTAQKVTWDLSSVAGQPVRLEIVDGDAGGAYAWLGVGRIEPTVVRVESFADSDSRDRSLRSLAGLLRSTAPADLRESLAAWLPPSPAPPPLPVAPGQRAALDKLISARVAAFSRAKPDPGRGAMLYRTHCAVCHQIGGEGGLIGPQLDGIGKRGVERLCEDILDPNRNVDAHFHLHSVTLADGRVMGGFARSETAQVLRLVDAAGQEHAVPKTGIASTQISPLSLMPPNFGDLLDETALRDLLGWLLGR